MADTFDALADFRMDGHNVISAGGAQNIGAGVARSLAGAGAAEPAVGRTDPAARALPYRRAD